MTDYSHLLALLDDAEQAAAFMNPLSPEQYQGLLDCWGMMTGTIASHVFDVLGASDDLDFPRMDHSLDYARRAIEAVMEGERRWRTLFPNSSI